MLPAHIDAFWEQLKLETLRWLFEHMALSWTLELLANHSSVGLGRLIPLQPHSRPY
jgi:hypothetical protein